MINLWGMASMLLGLVRSSASIAMLWRSSVMNGGLWCLLWWLAMKIWYAIRVCWSSLGMVCVASTVIGMTVLTARWLRYVWYNLHTTRNDTSRPSAACCIRRCRRASKALGELLHEGLSNVVSSNVNSIGNTEDN